MFPTASRRLGRHDDYPGVLGQLDPRIERPDEAVLHDSHHGHWTLSVLSEKFLDGHRPRVGGKVGRRHGRLGGHLLIPELATVATVIGLRPCHDRAP
jgi:hypothetical protein